VAVVECEGVRVALAPGETVLDGLLRAGLEVSFGCRAGACQACLIRATSGTPPRAAQTGLRDTLRAQGYFLACTAMPEEDLHLARAAMALNVPARIAAVEPLGADVVRVRVEPEQAFAYQPGQFVNVVRSDGLTRSYSLASLPDEDAGLELHVRRLPGGRMSGWLSDARVIGERIELRGPAGQCFYVAGELEQPLLLAGAGTGLAPLVGILRAALRAGHRGPITLLHGARAPLGHYLVDALGALAARHPQVTYQRCALEGAPEPGLVIGRLDQVVQSRHPSLAGMRVFLCGDPELVLAMRRQAFLAGASLRDIHADAFITAPPPPARARG
jgi:CDP-4-dehydro-6-deoxyglucose reductase